jgi:DNA-binding NarL/FixJ family response regulator
VIQAPAITERGSRRSLVVADTYTLVAECAAKVLESRFDSISIASTGEQLRHSILSSPPSLVLCDSYLPGTSCIQMMSQMHEEGGAPPFLFFPAEADPHTVSEAMAGGARGFIDKRCSVGELTRAVDCVLEGNTYVSARLVLTDPEPLRRSQLRLTTKQLQILGYVARGMRAQEIADFLHLSTRTVESHKRAIMRQLHVRSSIEMVRAARMEGLVP